MAVGEYASLISLIQDLDQIERLRNHGRIDFDAEMLQNLRVTLRSLVSSLEETNSQKLTDEIEALIKQISPPVVEVEFIIGRFVVDQFSGAIFSEIAPSLSQVLNGVIQKFEFIDRGLKKLMSENDAMRTADPDYSDSVAIEDVQIEWDDQLKWAIDKLTSHEKSRQVISIFAKPGVDMTTFARSLYNHPGIQNRFYKWMCWCTISEKYNVKEVLQVILGESCSGEASELGMKVHHKLHKRRYFVVMDDVQEIKAWEKIIIHLPDSGNCSRILVTTRNLDVANASSSDKTNVCALGYSRRLYALKKIDACRNENEETGKDVAELEPVRANVRFENFNHTTSKVVRFENKVDEVISHMGYKSRGSHEHVIPIVGMGGIGKTTFAQLVFNHPQVERQFDVRLCCTVSKNMDLRVILEDLEGSTSSSLEIHTTRLYQKLRRRKYLIVLDDVWDVSAWHMLRSCIPKNGGNGSTILVTTRSSQVSEECRSSEFFCRLDPWDDNQSWCLLREKIFGEDDCPVELEEIGKKIAKACGGLPLSLVAIAGVLSKSKMTASSWEVILKNMKSTGSVDEHRHLKVLSMSYYALPMHLKPCFLHFRNFYEDAKIRVSVLLREWIVEGYVQPAPNKTIQEIADEYFCDLVGSNLVLIRRRNSLGKIKECSVHDLVLEMCIQESAKETFPSIPRFMMPWFKENKTCFMCFKYVQNGEFEKVCLTHVDGAISSSVTDILVCNQCKKYPSLEKFVLVNFLDKKYPTTLRAVDLKSDLNEVEVLPPTMLYFWNLQVLILNLEPAELVESDVQFLSAIWDMPQLRYVDIGRVPLPSPPKANSSCTVLSELQKLSAFDLVLSDELIERIPNTEILKLRHSHYLDCSDLCLHLLAQFPKLESLRIDDFYDFYDFEMYTNLQVFKLVNVWDSKTRKWIMMPGFEFPSLKALVIRTTELEFWSVAECSFPVLESLVLEDAENLEIPIGFAQLDCLNEIHLNRCGGRTLASSLEVKKEHPYGSDLKLYFDGKLQREYFDDDD
ncbi:hypothetical protein M569_08671 [Genlisea aurea]|uniref:NB-ARC domain-containing protein n=1 Tax=Genlisea aurea TaxID=192259 RepID=S8CMT0_9LAMI|nr:hypothetical protein M569_08671 [Genlisea aurea]